MGYYLVDGSEDHTNATRSQEKIICKMSRSSTKGCKMSIWCAQISIHNYMWFIAYLEHGYNEGYNVGMYYIA